MSKKDEENLEVNSEKFLNKPENIEEKTDKELVEDMTSKSLKEAQIVDETDHELKQDLEQNKLAEQAAKKELVDSIKSSQSIKENVETFGKIMDTYGLKVILSWLPFFDDIIINSISLLFFIWQNSKLPEKFQLGWLEKAKIAGLEAGDAVVKTVAVSPFSTVEAATDRIPFLGAGIKTLMSPFKWGISSLVDHAFKANKRSAQIFTNHIEKIKDEAFEYNMKQTDANDKVDISTLTHQSQEMQNAMSSISTSKEVSSKKSEDNGRDVSSKHPEDIDHPETPDHLNEDINKARAEKLLNQLKDSKNIKEQVDTFALWMDGKYGLGIDSIAGLFERLGDTGSFLVSTVFLLYQAHRMDLSWWNRAKIVGYQLTDLLAGSIPIIGDFILDPLVVKSNRRSAELFQQQYEKMKSEALKNGISAQNIQQLESDNKTRINYLSKAGELKNKVIKNDKK